MLESNNQGSRADRTTEQLKEKLITNKSKLSINKDGFVSLNIGSKDAQTAIKKQLRKLEGIAV